MSHIHVHCKHTCTYMHTCTCIHTCYTHVQCTCTYKHTYIHVHVHIYIQAGHSCGDNLDLINSYPTGCVRISFGYMSTFNDAQVLVTFLKDCFLNMGDMNDTVSTLHYGDSLTLEKEILTKNTEYEHVTNSKLDSKVMSCVDADIKEQDTCTDVLQNNNELSLVTSNCNSVPIRMTDQSECDIVPDPHAMNIITGLSDQARTINDSKDDVMLHVGSLLRACLRSGKRK